MEAKREMPLLSISVATDNSRNGDSVPAFLSPRALPTRTFTYIYIYVLSKQAI